ncbi:transcription factor RFX4-like [Lineus longissimus]|uniref:transcription factor RFX4-like n=1 Tax=Lineus longissimus TaxID=88925 RepID=UPI00315CE514
MFDLYEMIDEMFNEIAPSAIRPAQAARHKSGSLDQEIRELKTAYLSMRKMAADYDKMEIAFNEALDLEDSGYATDVTGPCPDAAEWLNTNYEEHEGISLPRSVMYSHYIDHCHDNETEPMNQASFGKIIRTVFPNIKTRRLGNRGQSKYHYYGIKIKENSPYREVMVNAQRVNTLCASPKTAFSKSLCPDGSLTPSTPSASQTSLTLPEFPNINDLRLPAQIKDTTGVFLMMYRHHSQRIIDTVLRANFAEVKGFITHFWTTLPSHVSSVLYHDKVIKVIRLCDTILYSSIINVLIPGIIQPLPASLLQAIRAFSRNYLKWLEDALSQQPVELQKQKMQAARTFTASLTRQTEVSHMASVARSVLHNSDSIRRLQQDWKKLDKESIVKQCSWLLMEDEDKGIKLIGKYLNDFEMMMEQQTTIDRYIEWVRGLVARFIEKVGRQETHCITLMA